jgi:formylglycine-generating enzyme required for sulfatase activity
VSWEDAKTYCEWADRRLPTEAEWEKTARGENAFIYPWGDTFDGSLANFCDTNCSFSWKNDSFDDGFEDTSPVGNYTDSASPYGAFDMAGNVYEWVGDWYDSGYYGNSPASNPQGPENGSNRVIRGGSWDDDDFSVRSTDRFGWGAPSDTDDLIGFRCAMDASSEAEETSQFELTNTPSPPETSVPPTPTSELGIGSTMTGNDGMTVLYVPAGEFTMGSEDGVYWEQPVHKVYIDAFWIDQTEVTNAMYARCVDASICNLPSFKKTDTRESYYGNSNFDNYPVVYVSWNDADDYCTWTDRRLPTEAEWEKVARGENANIYPWGDTFEGDLVNSCDTNCSSSFKNNSFDDGFEDTSPVGSYLGGASPYGALDMAGNVSEWVNDWFDSGYYGNSPKSNPQGPESGIYRVSRGGTRDNNSRGVRSTYRILNEPARTFDTVGFRCAMDAE